jgi:hypothetical protein
MRRSQSLSGIWEFGLDRDGSYTCTSLQLERETLADNIYREALAPHTDGKPGHPQPSVLRLLLGSIDASPSHRRKM